MFGIPGKRDRPWFWRLVVMGCVSGIGRLVLGGRLGLLPPPRGMLRETCGGFDTAPLSNPAGMACEGRL